MGEKSWKNEFGIEQFISERQEQDFLVYLSRCRLQGWAYIDRHTQTSQWMRTSKQRSSSERSANEFFFIIDKVIQSDTCR